MTGSCCDGEACERPQVEWREVRLSVVSVVREVTMRGPGVSVERFERGRHLLCRTAWQQDKQCDVSTLAGLSSLSRQ